MGSCGRARVRDRCQPKGKNSEIQLRALQLWDIVERNINTGELVRIVECIFRMKVDEVRACESCIPAR